MIEVSTQNCSQQPFCERLGAAPKNISVWNKTVGQSVTEVSECVHVCICVPVSLNLSVSVRACVCECVSKCECACERACVCLCEASNLTPRGLGGFRSTVTHVSNRLHAPTHTNTHTTTLTHQHTHQHTPTHTL